MNCDPTTAAKGARDGCSYLPIHDHWYDTIAGPAGWAIDHPWTAITGLSVAIVVVVAIMASRIIAKARP